MSDISSIQSSAVGSLTGPGKKATAASGAAEKGFGETLTGFLNDINKSHQEAEGVIEDVVAGRTEHLHKAVIAINKAELSFRYMMEVRTKLLQAYQEIQRMQV